MVGDNWGFVLRLGIIRVGFGGELGLGLWLELSLSFFVTRWPCYRLERLMTVLHI